MKAPSVAEALANRKPDEAPVNLRVTFTPENMDQELAQIAAAQRDYEITKHIENLKRAS
jgi:hypothetical protein